MITKKCRDCGCEFTVSDGEEEFYRSKGFEIPNRCKSCRDKRKKASASAKSESSLETAGNVSRRSRFSLPAAIIAAALLAAVILGFSDIAVPTQTSSAEITYTSAYINSETQATEAVTEYVTAAKAQTLHFRSEERLEEHYEKHGIEMGFASAEEYEAAAAAVVTSPDALHKLEKEDNDDVYYIESTNEFVIVSTDGYIRTYFNPNGGREYFDDQ